MRPALTNNEPIRAFTTLSSIAVVVGIVIGIGIFRLPSIVASHSGSELQFILFWIAGGFISLLGALCYAELGSSRPDTGGEYHFLSRAFGPNIGFLFSWGRMTVIQTGSIAIIAFILGDYATLILDLGPYSSAIYAALTIIILTALNLLGTRHSIVTQNILATLIVCLLVFLSVSGFIAKPPASPPSLQNLNMSLGLLSDGSAGLAMIFVLLTYGGWNEAAYLSGELRDVKRNMVKVLVLGICLIICLYVMINLAYLHVLGLEHLRNSETAIADLSNQILGTTGSLIVTCIVMVAAISTANATIITGSRTNYALGRDFKMLGFIGYWDRKRNVPTNALIVQGSIALTLVCLGVWSKEAISTIVDYTAPVFWLFMLLTTLTLFVFRRRDNARELPFRVPFYPVTPILFVLVCFYMLYASIVFTGSGALIGVAILAAGIPVYLLAKKYQIATGLDGNH